MSVEGVGVFSTARYREVAILVGPTHASVYWTGEWWSRGRAAPGLRRRPAVILGPR